MDIPAGITGQVSWELTDKDGNIISTGCTKNIVTDTGDQYSERSTHTSPKSIGP